MHVAINALAVGGDMTGIGRYGQCLAAGATASRHRITTIGDAGVPGCQVYQPESPSQLWEQLELPDWLAENEVHIYHSPLFTCPIISNTPAVVTVHDAIPWKRPDLCSAGFLQFFNHRIGPSLRAARWLVTTSEHARDEICEVTGLALDRVDVIYQAIDGDFFDVAMPASGNLKLPERYVLYTGMLEPRKNVERLIRAFGSIAADVPHHLVMIGRTDAADYSVETTIREAGLTGRVHLPGYVDQHSLISAYRNADLFAFPSLYEGFGRPVIEAMASGTPVLCSNTTSLPEVAAGAAELVDPLDEAAIADGMRRILNDRDRQAELAQAGRERAHAFTPAAFAERLGVFYDRLEAQRCG